ncbi:unnamed protein product [Cochlearia groenlandica]
MPQDHASSSSWDRKEILRSRKHDRTEQQSSSSFDSTPFRWRDSPSTMAPSSHHHVPREFSRWGSGGDFRRPSCHGKQGGRHQFDEESSHGYSSSRSSARMFEDDYYRPSASRGDWRYPRNCRDDRVSLSQKDWKYNTWEMSNGSSRGFERPCGVRNGRRSVDERPPHASDYHTAMVNPWDTAYSNHQHDIKVYGARNFAKESSMGEIGKLPTWTCSGSFASQNSGFSHSSSLKSLGAVDSSDRKNEVLPKVIAVAQSSSGDPPACATSTHLPDEMSSRKKQRLGWGEGLAKYEKKTVTNNSNEDGTTLLENGTKEMDSLNKSIADRSPIAAIAPDCGSPTTPSSVACSSSPGFADKSSAKDAVADIDVSNTCRSPSPVSSIHLEKFPINIEEVDNISIQQFGCLLNELLGSGDPGTGDSCAVQLKSMNRLLSWKSDILKAVEMAESEIDQLENIHKMLKLEDKRHCRVARPSSYPCEGDENVPKEQEASCILGPKATASSVAETPVRDLIHQAVLAKVPNDVCEDGPREATSQSFATVESNEDMVPTPSMTAAASSEENNKSAIANQVIIELSSTDDTMTSDEDLLCVRLLSSNKKHASESSEVFNELLPRDFSSLDDSRFSGICQSQFDSRVKEKIGDRIELLRGREKILLLRFKAFQLLWEKDLQQLDSKKNQAKTSKKTVPIYLNARNSRYLKHYQPIRVRFSSSASRRDGVATTTELVSYMEKLLPDTHLKPLRDILRMPAMILDEKERSMSRFISTNGLIEDSCDVEKERTMINPWTSEEKETFLNMLATHGKNFKKISSYLTLKTTADCIDYYYKNQKSDSFKKIKKQRDCDKEWKHTYMMAPRNKWKREMGAASLDILGAVSIIAANAARKVAPNRQISSKRITLRGCSSSNSLQHDGNNSEECSYSFEFPRKRTAGGDLLGVGPSSAEQINSCLRKSVGSRERCIDHLKFEPVVKNPQISHSSRKENSNEEDDSCSEESCGETGPIHWTDDERSAFIQGFSLFGKNFASISNVVGTRSQDQCKVFFSKVRKCLGLESIQPGSGNVSTSASVGNGNASGDLEDGFAMESDSGICNNVGFAKMDLNSPNENCAIHSSPENVKAELGRTEQENGVVACVTAALPCLVSDSRRDTDEKQCDSAPIRKSNDLQSMEIDECNLTSVAVSSEPVYCGLSVLSNAIVESPIEASGRGLQGTAMPKHSSKYQDGMVQAAKRSKTSCHESETAPSGFKYPDCLHHVPIEVSIEDLSGIAVPRESPTNSFVGQVVETQKVDIDSDVNLEVLGHVKPEQNGQATTAESFQVSERFSAQDPSKIGRSKSDLIVKARQTCEGFSLNKCTSPAATTNPQSVPYKEGRFGHSRSHSFSLSDTKRLDNNADVKLFGTVLTADENRTKTIRSSSSSTLTSAMDHDQQHLQNVPITSYGFWDGNRIQTGLTSLPESAKLLASSPEAFTAHLKQQYNKDSPFNVRVGILSFGKHNKDRTESAASNGNDDEGNNNNNIGETKTTAT